MDATIAFEQVVETVRQCSLEQMKVLSDLMRRWEIEAVGVRLLKRQKNRSRCSGKEIFSRNRCRK